MLEQMIGQIKAELAASPKKAAVLGLLVVVMALLGVKAVAGGRTPQQASAASLAPAAATQAAARPETDATGGDAESRRRLSDYLAGLDVEPGSRNLFQPDMMRYPMLAGADATALADDADLDAAAAMARRPELSLQSTLALRVPTAIINGHALTEGETIAGCRIVRVGKGFCVLQQGDHQFTLTMDGAREAHSQAATTP